jgi:hypothetical protein
MEQREHALAMTPERIAAIEWFVEVHGTQNGAGAHYTGVLSRILAEMDDGSP